MSAVMEADQVKAAIRATLRGPVLQTMRQLVPVLGQVPEHTAYDHVIGSIHLLDLCFRVFRRQRDRFRHVLLDQSGLEVADDITVLRCGRSVADVVAMVVRTAARRYFRRHLGGEPRAKVKAIPGRIRPNRVRTTNAAEDLYDCIKAYLLHDWQVPLVPTYARISPDQVRHLGAGLLDLDTRGKLARAFGLTMPAVKAAVKLGGIADAIAAGAKPLRFERRAEGRVAPMVEVEGKIEAPPSPKDAEARAPAYPVVIWSEDLRVGSPDIDSNHQRLIGIVNEFRSRSENWREDRLLHETLKTLLAYGNCHFATEEKIQSIIGYERADAHCAEHRGFIKDVTKMAKSLFIDKSLPLNRDSVDRVNNFLENWLTTHIKESDAEIRDLLLTNKV